MNINIKNGIKFKCQGSGNCCVSRGSYGYVYLSKKDLKRLSGFFKISYKLFKKKYCQLTDGFLHLKEANINGNCVFLKNKKCTIYKARPTQCRTWPFWSENMNQKIWNKDIVNFCPGVGKGKLMIHKKIEELIKVDIQNDMEIINQKKN